MESISRCSKLFYIISRCHFHIESTFSRYICSLRPRSHSPLCPPSVPPLSGDRNPPPKETSAPRSCTFNVKIILNTYLQFFDTKVKCCKGNTEALYPTKKVYNLYTNICSLPVSLHVKECVCFYCHLTLFMRNKLIYRGFKSVR